jgi:protein tyrosine phosphatase (PTP) superfamily phosphohydrolase (DUF442 family)
MKHGQKTTIMIGLFLCAVGWAPAEEAKTPMIDIPNAVVIGDGILGGGQPDEDALRRAAHEGYRTILNMRGPGEEGSLDNEEELVRSLGMTYVALPISSGDAFNEKTARRLADILDEPDALPAMVHCASGNRVGILFGMKAFYVDGVEGPAALEFGTKSGARRIPEHVRSLLGGEAEK